MTSTRNGLLFATLLIAAAPIEARTAAFDIPAGPLGQSLAQLGRQARVSVGLGDPALAVRTAPAIRGRMSVDRALARLLDGSGARAVRIDGQTFRIERAPPRAVRRPPPPPPKPRPPPAPKATGPEQDIVITASRRQSRLSNYPGSVTVVDSSDPMFAGAAQGTHALAQRLPEVTTTHLGPGRNKLFIRGMSESSVNGTTQATVGQYLGDFRLNYNAPDPDLRLFDMSRVEVLEGPQGTLYGAGALGGIIRLVPNMPEPGATFGRVSAGLSSTAHGNLGSELAATANLSLSSALAARLTTYRVVEGGYIDDVARGLDDVNRVRTSGARFATRLYPADGWTLDGTIVGQSIKGDDAQYAQKGLGKLERGASLTENFSNRYRLVGLSAGYDGFARGFTVSANHVRHKLFERFDGTSSITPLIAYDLTTNVSLFAGEARLTGRPDHGGSWVAGAALYSSSARQDRDVEAATYTARRHQVTTKSLETALFGEYQFPVTSGTDVTIGARVSRNQLKSKGVLYYPQSGSAPLHASDKGSGWRLLPTLAISTRPVDDLLLFARYQEGFRPGGLSIGVFSVRSYDPDRVRSFETGLRLGRPGRSEFDLALAAGFVHWTDVQSDSLDRTAELMTTNIGNARNIFLDVSANWRPAGGLQLSGGFVLVDSKITSGPVKGNELPGVAPINARGSASYRFNPSWGGTLNLIASLRYTGKSYLDSGRTLPTAEEFLRRPQGDWLDAELLAQARFQGLHVTLGVTNLFDSTANRFALGTPLLLHEEDFTAPVRPRTLRLAIEVPLGR